MADSDEKIASKEPVGNVVLDIEIVRAATEVANTQIANFTRRLSSDFKAAALEAERPHKLYGGKT